MSWEAKKEYLRQRYEAQHATLQELGDEFGVTRERMRQVFKRLGIETRDNAGQPKGQRALRIQQAIQLKRTGMKQAEIAKLLNRTQSWVSLALRGAA